MTATVDGWMTYAEERGDVVAQGNAASEALVRGQDYITYHYVNRLGTPAPEPVLDAAVYEAAKAELAEPGFWSKTYTPDQQKVLTQVGDIRWSIRGNASGSDAATPVSTKIDAMLRPYMWAITGFVV